VARLTGVMAAREVVGCVLLARDQLLWVEELAVGSCPDLVDDGRLKIQEHRTEGRASQRQSR